MHELTHGEFDNLLRRHFGHVALYGQRPLLGAVLIPEFAPAADAKPFLTFERRDRRLFEASTGLPRSIYLVAVVSDAPVELGRGCLFVETSDVEAIFARDAQVRDEQKRLTDRLIEEGEYARRVRAELNRRDEEQAALAARFRGELAEAARRESAVRLELSQERSDHASKRTRLGALQQNLVALRAEADSLARQLADTMQEKIRAEIGLEAVYRSSSWRLTGPMRALAGRHPHAVQRLRGFFVRHPQIRRMAVRSVRGTWRLLTLRSLRVTPPVASPSPAALSAVTVQAPETPAAALPAVTVQAPEAPDARFAFSPRRLSIPRALHPDALPRGLGRRLLFVSHVLPFPPRAGNEYRIHRLLDWLARENWKITLVLCPLPDDSLSEMHMAQMASVYPDLIISQHDGTIWYNLAEGVDVVEQLRGIVPRVFASLLGEADAPSQEGHIIQLQRSFCPDVLAELLLHLDEVLRPHVLLAEYIFMTRPFALLRPEMVKVVDTIDVFSTKASKVEQHGVSDGLALSREEEALLLRRADLLIGIQPEEAADIARLSPNNQVLSIGVDFRVIEQQRPLPPEPVVLLVASGNPMNVKGVQDFLQYAWPLVRRAVPQATLRVVGSIGEAIHDSHEGVQIAGQVDRLAPEYAAARVAINPAIAGTGLKIKTIEALCHLRPVVTWPVGVDGIGPEGRPFCHVATHWFGFAQALIELLTNDDKAGAIGNARDSLAYAVSPEQIYAPLRHALDQVG